MRSAIKTYKHNIDYTQSINRSFVYKVKEGCHVRIKNKIKQSTIQQTTNTTEIRTTGWIERVFLTRNTPANKAYTETSH
jgi:hypothetical protein